MPKSKTRKNHKKKLKARNLKIQHAKNNLEKQKQRILEQLIAEEQAAGKFDNNVNGDNLIIDDVDIQGPEI